MKIEFKNDIVESLKIWSTCDESSLSFRYFSVLSLLLFNWTNTASGLITGYSFGILSEEKHHEELVFLLNYLDIYLKLIETEDIETDLDTASGLMTGYSLEVLSEEKHLEELIFYLIT